MRQINKCISQCGPLCCRRTRCRNAASASSADFAAAGNGGAEDKSEENGFFKKLLKPLRDFGFGTRSFWEGGVGLFIFAGVGTSSCSHLASLTTVVRPTTALAFVLRFQLHP